MTTSTANPFVRRYTREEPAATTQTPPTSVDTPTITPDRVTDQIHPPQSVSPPHHVLQTEPLRTDPNTETPPPPGDAVAAATSPVQTATATGPTQPADQARLADHAQPADHTQPTEPVKTFAPAWEVDVLDVPSTVADLFFRGELFGDLAARLGTAVDGGLRSMLVTSLRPGQGRSTVAIGTALAAASGGKRVALVDADTSDPTLLGDLRMDAASGWIAAVRDDVDLSETAILAIEDGVTLFPLIPGGNVDCPVRPAEIVSLIDRLADHFDLILIDAASSSDAMLAHYAAAADSAIIVRDAAADDQTAIDSFCRQLTDCGVKGIGLVDNFV